MLLGKLKGSGCGSFGFLVTSHPELDLGCEPASESQLVSVLIVRDGHHPCHALVAESGPPGHPCVDASIIEGGHCNSQDSSETGMLEIGEALDKMGLGTAQVAAIKVRHGLQQIGAPKHARTALAN